MILRACFRSLVVACVLVGTAPLALAQQPTAGDYQQLQRTIADQEARLRQLETSRLPAIGPVESFYDISTTSNFENRMAELEEMVYGLGEGKPANTKPTQKWSGRVHYDYWAFPDADALPNFLETGSATTAPSDFSGFRRLRFGVAGDIGDTMLYKVEMEFAVPSEPTIKDAYLGWQELPFLQTVLLGNQKRPYGLDHLNSSRYNVFLERPFIIEANNQDARRIGVCSYGVSKSENWNWRYGYFLMDDLSGAGGQRTDNYQSEVAGRLANTIWYDESSGGRGYAHWAVSGSLGFPGGGADAGRNTRPEARTGKKWLDTGAIPGNTNLQMVGLEGVVNIGALQVVGEYQQTTVQRIADPNLNFNGYYVQAAYFLTGEHTPWERDSGTLGRVKPFENFFLIDRCCGGRSKGIGAWQVAARYSHADFTDDNIFGGVGDSFTFGMNWWWTPNSRVQFNYIHGSIAERSAGPFVNASGDYDAFGTRFMVDF